MAGNEERQVENELAGPSQAANDLEPQPLKTQYVISSESEEGDDEDSVGNNDISTDEDE